MLIGVDGYKSHENETAKVSSQMTLSSVSIVVSEYIYSGYRPPVSAVGLNRK